MRNSLLILIVCWFAYGWTEVGKTFAVSSELQQENLHLYPVKQSQWEGYDRYDFQFDGRDATIVVPKQVAKGQPWIWRPAFFGAFPQCR